MPRPLLPSLRALTLDLALAAGAVAPCAAAPAELTVPMALVDDSGVARPIGQVTVTESAFGLVFTPSLEGLVPGLHGFHVHENASCEPGEQNGRKVPALAAGGHYDPTGTRRHGAPWGDGHLGDLPPLYADIAGRAAMPVLAPRLKMADLRHRSLMVHAGADNHADHPMPLGGGGARIACGVVG